MSSSIGCLKGITEVVFLEMGKTILDINGRLEMGRYFYKRFLSNDGFFNRGLTKAVFRSRGAMPVVIDVLMMFVMVCKRMSRFS